MSNDLSEVIAAHEATNAKLLLRVAELEAECERERMRVVACGVVALANTRESAARAREMHPDYRSSSLGDVERIVDSEMALREQVATLTQQAQAADAALVEAETELDAAKDELATLTQQLETVRESEAEAAKADAARLREALEAAVSEALEAGFEEASEGGDSSAFESMANEIIGRATGATSAAWLESKIAERSSSAVLLVPALEDRIRLHIEWEKSLEQQLVATTNDAARAELRARDMKEALSAVLPYAKGFWRAGETPAPCITNAKSLLADSPDSDERLREVMNAAWEKGRIYERQAVTKPSATDEMNRKQDIDEVLRGGA